MILGPNVLRRHEESVAISRGLRVEKKRRLHMLYTSFHPFLGIFHLKVA